MLQRAAWLLAMMVLMSMTASAQSFTLVGDQQGLSGRGARVVAIDAAGFLWAASAGALHRWDGAAMRVYRAEADDPDSLPSGQIASVLCADDGTVYVVSAIGVSVYDPTRDAFATWRPSTSSISGARLVDKDRVLALTDRDAWLFDRTAGSWKRVQGQGCRHRRCLRR
jgi:ligand-binding sensor domain-containing protein